MTVFLRGYVLNLNEEIFILKQDTASQIYDDWMGTKQGHGAITTKS